MTSGTWSRHTGETETYDAVGLGYNYRLDEPRSALLLSRLRSSPADVERRRELTRAYRARLRGRRRRDRAVRRRRRRALHVLRDAGPARGRGRAATPCAATCATHGVQTSVFYPAVHEFTAYRERFGTPSLPRTEYVARAEITLPLFPDMDEALQDRVVDRARGGAA